MHFRKRAADFVSDLARSSHRERPDPIKRHQ
jgi:hypothetical protein